MTEVKAASLTFATSDSGNESCRLVLSLGSNNEVTKTSSNLCVAPTESESLKIKHLSCHLASMS